MSRKCPTATRRCVKFAFFELLGRIIYIAQMRPIATDITHSRGVTSRRWGLLLEDLSVCLCVGHTVELCKTGEPIEMPFWELTYVGPIRGTMRKM